MRTIFKSKFGSHLYGLNTPSSDTDFKGVYIPSLEDLLLQRVKKSIRESTKQDSSKKNSSDDVDTEIYSLHYFLEMGYKSITTFIDMIHTPDGFGEIETEEWKFLRANRSKFYTKNMDSLLGYAATQCNKYGLRSSRLGAAKQLLELIDSLDIRGLRIGHIWDDIPESEHLKKIKIPFCKEVDNRGIEVCSRILGVNTSLAQARDCVQKFYDNYGARAKLAEENNGVDWKCVSHAFRACYQVIEIFETGDLKYPLKEREFLLDLKQGFLHYKNDKVGEMLESLLEESKKLSSKSTYPEYVDKEFFEKWLVSLYV